MMQYDLLEGQSHHSFGSSRSNNNINSSSQRANSMRSHQSSGEDAAETQQQRGLAPQTSMLQPPPTAYIEPRVPARTAAHHQQTERPVINKDVDIGFIRHSLIAPCCCFLLNKPRSATRGANFDDDSGAMMNEDSYADADPLNSNNQYRNSNYYHNNNDDGGYGQVLINQNVLVMLLSAGMYGIADSVWSGTVLCIYILMLMGDNNQDNDSSDSTSNNKFVGYMEAVNGLAYMLAGPFLTRVLGRCLRNGTILNWFGLPIFVIVGALTIVVLDWVGTDMDALKDEDNDKADQAYVYFIVLMALWGFRQRLMNGPAQQLFVDSCQFDDHDKFRVALFAVYIIASSLGALLSIIVFSIMGDDWTLNDLRNVMYVGISLELLVGVLLFFFNDRKAIQERQTPYEEKHFPGPPSSAFAESTVYQSADENADERNLQRPNPQEEDESISLADGVDFDAEESSAGFSLGQGRMTPLEYALTKRIFAYSLFAQSFVINVGSGLTIKFFPPFFRFDTGASPSEIQSIYCVLPILMVFCSGISRRFSETNGQIKTILQVKCTGLACLYAMALGGDTVTDQRWLTLILFLVYKAFMSSTHPIEEQLTFQYVDKEEFKWFTNLDTLSRIGWAVSAAVGGVLIDSHDYQYVLLIAAIVQTFGIFFIALLMPLTTNHQTFTFHDDDSEGSDDEFSSDFSESIDPSHQAFGSSSVNESSDDLKIPLINRSTKFGQGTGSGSS
eukprot:CAMPEP_0196809072 /NCGR_PEP_ID=MMETSP1362-20130617/9037_1 /TAXON_ID=163516 /ORGANISM="Leptocylindrus danicus, Strain CCMP1856" /LENGTH=727 /DNA_ID=CAMNT_0042183639 /DNA_START=195 /DNA_END=2378 /DNA_ORIENTATION=+